MHERRTINFCQLVEAEDAGKRGTFPKIDPTTRTRYRGKKSKKARKFSSWRLLINTVYSHFTTTLIKTSAIFNAPVASPDDLLNLYILLAQAPISQIGTNSWLNQARHMLARWRQFWVIKFMILLVGVGVKLCHSRRHCEFLFSSRVRNDGSLQDILWPLSLLFNFIGIPLSTYVTFALILWGCKDDLHLILLLIFMAIDQTIIQINLNLLEAFLATISLFFAYHQRRDFLPQSKLRILFHQLVAITIIFTLHSFGFELLPRHF